MTQSQKEILFTSFGLMAALGIADLFFLLRRRLQRDVPWFAAYLVLIIVQSLVSIALIQYAPLYVWYYVGWSFAGLDLAFEYMFTLEVIRNMLVDYPTIRSWVRSLLLTAAAIFVVVALIAIPYGADQPNIYMKVTHITVRTVRIIQVALLLTFFAVARYLGLSWKNYRFGILLGLGLYASSSLACEAYIAEMGASVGWKVNLIDSYASICVMFVYLVYLFKAETKIPPPSGPPSTHDLEEWNEALTDVTKR